MLLLLLLLVLLLCAAVVVVVVVVAVVHPNRVSAAVDFNVYIPFWTWAGRTEMQMSLFLGRWNRNDIS